MKKSLGLIIFSGIASVNAAPQADFIQGVTESLRDNVSHPYFWTALITAMLFVGGYFIGYDIKKKKIERERSAIEKQEFESKKRKRDKPFS